MDNINSFKSWWILPPSTRFNPPSLPGDEDDGIGQAKGSMCPGHFIPAKSRQWNKILNRTGPLPYPPEMPVNHDERWDMSWKLEKERGFGLSAKVKAPTAEMIGLAVDANAEAAFKTSVTNYINFDKLDAYTIQPWDSYIADSLNNEEIDSYIRGNKSILGSWEVYMVSGIVVARGASMNQDITQTSFVDTGGAVGSTAVAQASAGGKLAKRQHNTVSVSRMSDFVWAIQIARVYKDVGYRKWQWETLWDTKGTGATFAIDERAMAKQRFEKGQKESSDDGLVNAQVFGLETGNNVFVVPVWEVDPADSLDPKNSDD
ncbi:hypothetical protein F5B19DRAFT_170092 [Rostrohypoxylon terebratum]|nr:hypothetical protein F5B19DRAFT_170092 [Rostrohypoxylon terebratum]